MKTETLFSRKSDEWETPQDLFDQLDAEFHFDFDACATSENAKLLAYFDKDLDGLKFSWGGVESVVQSTIQQRACLGEEGFHGIQRAWHSRGNAAAGKDGHEVVPAICSAQSRGEVYKRPAAILWSKRERAVSVDDSDLQRTRR